MRFRLRTLLIAAGVLPPLLAIAWNSETRMFVLPLAVAFLGGLFLPYGFRTGLGFAAVIVVANAALMEKDPSGLGPNAVVIPFHLAVFALPAAGLAWLGKAARTLFEPEFP